MWDVKRRRPLDVDVVRYLNAAVSCLRIVLPGILARDTCRITSDAFPPRDTKRRLLAKSRLFSNIYGNKRIE